jgi:hypothetical protein
MDREQLAARLKTPGSLLIAALIVVAALRGLPAAEAFPTAFQWGSYWPSLLQFLITTALAVAIVRTKSGQSRMRGLLVLAVVDLMLLSVRMHLALPSEDLELHARAEIDDIELLRDGYLDITDLAELEVFLYGSEHRDGPKAPIIERWTARSARELVQRRWPVHLGNRHNIRGLSGRAKMPPDRATALLAPLALALAKGSGPGDRLEDNDIKATRALFTPDGGIGTRVMALYGIPIAVGKSGTIAQVSGLAPPCYSPESTVLVSESKALVQRLITRPFRTRGPALIEGPLSTSPIHTASSIRCPEPGQVQVQTETDSLAVLRIRHHPGWQVLDDRGRQLESFPVNMVHTGVLLPPGNHQLSYSFKPPGLMLSLIAMHLALLALLTLAAIGRGHQAIARAPDHPDSR